MAKISGKRTTTRSPYTKKQGEVIKALENAAKQAGLRVSAGKLRFAGLKLKGGSCLLRGNRWLVLDREQPFEDQIDIFRQALTASDLSTSSLSEELKLLITPYIVEKGISNGSEASSG